MISAGEAHTVALGEDGTIWTWGGMNCYGQLGNATSGNPVPVQGFTNAIAVAAGRSHTVAVRADGTVWAWGNNFAGQFGVAPRTDRTRPAQVFDFDRGRYFNVFATYAPEVTVRFHFDDTHVDVPVLIGQRINPSLIPIPATRYGRPESPGQAFMGWFTVPNPVHRIHAANRATAFNLNASIVAGMLDNNGVLNLYGSWLQFGDVNGDGRVFMDDHTLLQAFFLGLPVILGSPDPHQP